MNKSIIISAIVVVLVGGGAFFAGTKYQQSQQASQRGQFRNQLRPQTAAGGAANTTPVRGQVVSTDNNSLTVKMTDGSNKIVLLTDSTAITEATSASKQALQNGQQVMVIGTQNSDGSVTAQNIQLNPQIRNQ